MVNTAPPRGRLATEIRPPIRIIRSRAIDRPMPVPSSPLVVKNGSKMRWRIAGGTPLPSSSTLITTRRRPALLLTWPTIRIEPPRGIASRALSSRIHEHLAQLGADAPDRRQAAAAEP